MIIQRHSDHPKEIASCREFMTIGQRFLDDAAILESKAGLHLIDDAMSFAELLKIVRSFSFRDTRFLMFPSDQIADVNANRLNFTRTLFEDRGGKLSNDGLPLEWIVFSASVRMPEDLIIRFTQGVYAVRYWEGRLSSNSDKWTKFFSVKKGKLMYPEDIIDQVDRLFTISASDKQIEDFASVESLLMQLKPMMKKYPRLHESISFEGNNVQLKTDFLL